MVNVNVAEYAPTLWFHELASRNTTVAVRAGLILSVLEAMVCWTVVLIVPAWKGGAGVAVHVMSLIGMVALPLVRSVDEMIVIRQAWPALPVTL